MITSKQLQDRIKSMPSIRAVAREARMPEKTVYRTAHGKTDPKLETVQRILNAIAAIETRQAA